MNLLAEIRCSRAQIRGLLDPLDHDQLGGLHPRHWFAGDEDIVALAGDDQPTPRLQAAVESPEHDLPAGDVVVDRRFGKRQLFAAGEYPGGPDSGE